MTYQVLSDDFIEKLFKGKNFGEPVNSSTQEKRKLIKKNLQAQIQGYWSGHTIYNILIEAGFLKDAKPGKKKELTLLGEEFLR